MATASKKTVDFSNVKDGGQFNTHQVPEGDYLATIVSVADGAAKSDDVFQYIFTIKLQKHSSYAYPYYCKLAENQLWKLRNLAIAAGLNVPKKRVAFDPNRVVGKTIGVTMEDDEYEGKMKSVIAAVFPSAELMEGSMAADDDDDVQDDIADDVEDDIEDDEDDSTEAGPDQFDAMDRTALKAFLKSADANFVAKKSQTDDDLRELARAAGGDDEDVEDEEEEEPAPAPAPRKAAAARKPAAAARKPAAAVSDEELEELDIDDI